MKKITLIAISLLFLSSSAWAQGDETDARTLPTFGIKVGLNNSNVYDTKGENFVASSRFGFAGGVFIGIPLGKYIGVQPEVLFSQKGFKSTGSLLGSDYKLERVTNNIDIPLLLQFKPIEYLTILLGPQYSYLIKQTDTYTYGVNSVEQAHQFEVDKDNYRKNILSFCIGGDVHYQHVVFGIRANYDFQTNNSNGTTSTPRYKNAWYQFSIGYRLYSN